MVNFGNRYKASENQDKNIQDKNIKDVPDNAGTGFMRFAGYDNAESFREFLTGLYAETKTDGVFIDRNIPNPSSPEVNAISSALSISDNFSEQYVRDTISKISGTMLDFSKIGTDMSDDRISGIFCRVLEDIRSTGAAQNTLRNAFIKFICWCIRYSTFKITNILYVGEITKYEVYWLYIMHCMGCKVNYVCFSGDSSYLETDPHSRYSVLKRGSITAPLNINFRGVSLEAINKKKKMQEILTQNVRLSVNSRFPLLRESFDDEILKPYNQRTDSFGNCFDDGKITVYFSAFIGFDEESSYRNFLYFLRENILKKSKKTLVFAEHFKKPSYDEGAAFLSVNRSDMQIMIASLAERIDIPSCPARTILARRSFIEIMNSLSSGETNIQRMFNLGVNMIIWLKSCTSHTDFKSDIPVMMYYGKITYHELIFLKLLCNIGFDVVYVCSDKSDTDMIKSENDGMIQVFESPLSCPVFPYPDKPVRAKFATNAYNAERELDTLLYNDGNLFRSRQFAVCRSVTLKTTYEEIDILWSQESKYRTGFSSDEKLVTVPNIFAKISGVHEETEADYWRNVAAKITPSALIYTSLPFFVPQGADDYSGYFSGKNIDIPKLMNSPHNRYNYLNDNVQHLIFGKLQEAIDSDFINLPYPDIVHLVIKTGLGLGGDILRIIQNYDFTKEVPKVIIVDNTPKTFNVYECIYLVLLNLMAFDIIIYTPTGYKNLESYISPQAYESYVMPFFRDNFSVPNLRSIKPSKDTGKKFGGFFKWR